MQLVYLDIHQQILEEQVGIRLMLCCCYDLENTSLVYGLFGFLYVICNNFMWISFRCVSLCGWG
jgi:hypothetical protein